MRLLRRWPDNSGFSLVEHVGNNIPPYAILSHTWGPDDEEVTFKDLMEGSGKSKPGYRKLSFCGRQAAQDGLEYFWVDTCCIDKSSSAELAEAINSMFKWYQKADRCYVLLSDLPISRPVKDISQQIWAQIFQHCRWFQRGWTLQELLAPPRVDFFSKEGEWIGNKVSLMQALHSRTRIPVLALQGNPLSQFSVDERMSWAKERETRREEDVAYSILGIFGIHMSLIYGEGQEKALARLRRKVNRSEKDRPLVKPPKSSWTVPFMRDDDFINRDSLDKVCRICVQPAGRAALVGLGGVGKSQIAIEYAYRVRDQSPAKWVFWVHAGTRARFEEGYRRIAEATKMNGWNDKKVDILQLVRSWLCDESNGQWTMVIDNADDADVFFNNGSQNLTTGNLDESAELLSNFLPQSPNGSILVTSRNQDVAQKLIGASSGIVEVKPMDTGNALALLEKKLGFIAAKDDAMRLICALDFMPLAITQAAAFINQRAPRMSLSRYVDEVGRSDKDRARLLKKDVGDSRRDGQASNSIIATWQISFEHIRKQVPTAARLLSLMSMFDRQGIPESLLLDQYGDSEEGEVDFEDDIHTLCSFCLIEMSEDGREFEMHQLVQFSTKKWLELCSELEKWRATYAALMDASFPVGQHENWPVCHALFPHALAMVSNKPQDTLALEMWASVLFKAAWYVRELGQYRKAIELDFIALEVRRNVLGAEHPDTLNSLDSLGLVLEGQGNYREAETVHHQVMEVRERVLGPDDPSTLTSISNLASTYRKQGRWKDAEELFVIVLETRKIKLGVEHPHTLTSMAKLASTYWDQGRWKDAEDLDVQVLETRKTKLGESHPDTLVSMANLATTYGNQGRWDEAEELELQVLETRKIKLGEDHPQTLGSIANLASTYKEQGRWNDAEELEVQVLETRKTKLGESHPDTLVSMANLATTYGNQGRLDDAEELELQVLETRKTKLGEDHPDTLTSMANLAITYGNQDRWDDAQELEIQVLETRKAKLGEDHPDTLDSKANLASTYWRQGRWDDVEELEVQVLETRKTKFGEGHPDTLAIMNNLAVTWRWQGNHTKALDLMRECVQICRRVLGASHPETIASSATLSIWEAEQMDTTTEAMARDVQI